MDFTASITPFQAQERNTLYSSSDDAVSESWRKCSQEALDTLRSSGSHNSSKMLSISDTEDGQSATKSNAAAAAVLIPQTEIALAIAGSSIDLKGRFAVICQSDKDYRDLSYANLILHFPNALEFFAQMRNRYSNVLPTPLDIVTLNHRTIAETDYINASRFENMIITQGPFINDRVDTVADFWMMAFEQGDDIVCLTDHIQKTEKTFPYWDPKLVSRIPDPSQMEIVFKKNVGALAEEINFEVRLVESPVTAVEPNAQGQFVTRRKFDLIYGDKIKRINHWHFEKWADQSVCNPYHLACLIELLLVKPGVSIIHCSAGIGRSGVLTIAKKFIERYARTKQIPTEQEIDEAVIELRKRRPGSVQSAEQLDLIFNTIIAFIKKQTA